MMSNCWFKSSDCDAPFQVQLYTDTTADGDTASLAQRGMSCANKWLIDCYIVKLLGRNFINTALFLGVCLQYQQVACSG